MNDSSQINVALMGLGVVGGGVATALLEHSEDIFSKTGKSIHLKRILVRDTSKPRAVSIPADMITSNPEDILEDPTIQIVVEVMGGSNPAKQLLAGCLSHGKHVVTANKEVMAKYGPELQVLADKNKSRLLYEASVCAGIPIINSLCDPLLANKIQNIRGIINGTSNYILTDMAQHQADFEDALKEAQELGYAEADPTNDVDGFDAVYKLSILASLAFHYRVSPDDVYREGIRQLQAQDFQYARELGYGIKSLAVADCKEGKIQARVYPALIPLDNMIAKVDGVYNAVEVSGDLCGSVMLHGMGAGREPTTSAVIGDLIQLSRQIAVSGATPLKPSQDMDLQIKPIDELETRYYIRLIVTDTAGVLAQIAKILGANQISIASVLQKDTFPDEQKAELVITTHPSREASVQESLNDVANLGVVSEISNVIRIEE
ncbi:MAG: homoserine dehydrogenase [Chloroflexota bacterium]|nr:homoserine dehydrogenase [Chloroflexota bacterium]